MKLTRTLALILVVFGAAILQGCSNQAPTLPRGELRHSQSFWAQAIPILNQHYKDADLSVIVYGPEPLPVGFDHGDQVQLDSIIGISYFTVVGTLNTATQRPEIALLKDNDHNGPCAVFGVSAEGRYDCPKVDACYFYNEDHPEKSIIEVAVCYQVWDTDHNDWDIGFTTFRWELEDFPIGPPLPTQYSFVWDDTDDDPGNEQLGDYTPDIAYDNDTGDMYLVWMRFDPSLEEYPARLYYRWFDRDTGGWSTAREFYASPHNQWIPRIDVGFTNFFGDNRTVGVVYTSKGLYTEHPDLFFVGLAYTYTSESQQAPLVFDTPIVNTAYTGENIDLNAGLPQCEVAPNSDTENWGAITFVQEVYNDPEHHELGTHYEVFVTDSISNAFTPVHESSNEPRGILPSIAIHPFDTEHYASISYFEQIDDWTYSVMACLYEPENEPDPIATNYLPLGMELTSPWLPSDVFFMNPGMTTDIAVLSPINPNYWAVWCGTLDPDSCPTTVYGNYGRTTPW